jgi:quercetin dioxygenase-like cupin family protein
MYRHRLFAYQTPALACLCVGLTVGFLAHKGIAAAPAPTEHAGLSVEKLGVLPESSIKATTGLDGYFMQLRMISIAPGGQIAKHDHATRPGLVKVIEGAWVEGRPEGERTYAAGDDDGILEDENTVHWFFNRGDDTATAVVCDLTPSK